MSLLVTGTIGIDTVETPESRADDVLGGSAAYFALAASLLHPVRLVGVVGDDFPAGFREQFNGLPIDTAGLEIRPGAKTFRWHGKYLDDMNERESLRTDLNVVGEAPPSIPDSFRDSQYVFLANTHPSIQKQFIEQLRFPSARRVRHGWTCGSPSSVTSWSRRCGPSAVWCSMTVRPGC